jgi:hypothetical protein
VAMLVLERSMERKGPVAYHRAPTILHFQCGDGTSWAVGYDRGGAVG